MIGLQTVSPELRKPACLVFAPEGNELAVLRGVVMDYASQLPTANIETNPNVAPNDGRRGPKSVGDMTLRTLQALEIQDPKKGGATPAIVFTNEESRFVQAALNGSAHPEHSNGELIRKLAAQLASIDLSAPELADELNKAR